MDDKKINMVIECQECNKEFYFNITATQYQTYIARTGYIQDIFPELNPAEREMFISGICPECWDKMFGEEAM